MAPWDISHEALLWCHDLIPWDWWLLHYLLKITADESNIFPLKIQLNHCASDAFFQMYIKYVYFTCTIPRWTRRRKGDEGNTTCRLFLAVPSRSRTHLLETWCLDQGSIQQRLLQLQMTWNQHIVATNFSNMLNIQDMWIHVILLDWLALSKHLERSDQNNPIREVFQNDPAQLYFWSK